MTLSSSFQTRKHASDQGRTPMRNFLVPQSMQTARVGVRPFFMVTASMSLDAVLTLHLTQKISTDWDGVVIIRASQRVLRR